MLKEIVFVMWVCTPAAPGTAEGIGPVCRPEALTAAMPEPATPQSMQAVCAALNQEGIARWGISGSQAPDYGNPINCFGVDYTKSRPSVTR